MTYYYDRQLVHAMFITVVAMLTSNKLLIELRLSKDRCDFTRPNLEGITILKHVSAFS